MKKQLCYLLSAVFTAVLLTSCYSYTSVVGSGGMGQKKVTKWNHYLIDGLAPVSVSDSKQMAGESKDYTVVTQQTFVNGLISVLTFGIYTPTTTTVTK